MNNAKFALVIAETHRKDATRALSDSWQRLALNWRTSLPHDEETHRLTENVWLIPLDNGLPVLAGLVQAIKDYSVPIHVLFLEDAQGWIKYPPDAKTTAEA